MSKQDLMTRDEYKIYVYNLSDFIKKYSLLIPDLILIDLHQPNMQPNFNCKSNLVYSAGTRNVKLTMIHGKIVFENGKFLVGEGAERIYETCNRILKKCLAKQK